MLETNSTQTLSETKEERKLRLHRESSSRSYYKHRNVRNAVSLKRYHSLSPEEKFERNKRHRLKTLYGLTPAQFDQMLAAQGGRCAICQTASPPRMKWCVDHDHSTNQVRHILCDNCNTMLGQAREDPAILSAAIEYLRKFKNGGQEQETAG